MSHIDQGPLASYNSLADQHLTGYFTNTRMRRHLRKAGLITRRGEIVSENTYRLNMSRKEHKKHVKDMLAQAIVHKTLDLERTRQAEIRKKFEEIAKIELVRRVRGSEQRKREQDLLPYLSPRGESQSSRPTSSSTATSGQPKKKCRATSAPPRKGRRPMSAISSNYDEDEEVIYLDDEGRPITPAHVDEAELRYSSKDPIDTRHLYSLDTQALRKYAMLMAKMEQGRGVTSPYVISQVPLPPKSPRSGRTPRSAHRYKSGRDASTSNSPKRPATALHPAGSPKRYQGQQETMCEVNMCYHGSNLSLAREQFDKRQDIVVEQQHCGGNTLTVFRDKLEPDTKFSFVSYRHRGYPFSLTIYVDGKMDCRVSTCCEYRHQKGGRLGGKNGHFSIIRISGAIPCYKCQVEKGIRGKPAPKRKMKRPPQQQEEVVVLETEREEPKPKPVAKKEERQVEILVPVEDEEQKAKDTYEDDFESSSSESEQEEVRDGLTGFQPKDARGVDKTTGKVDIHDLSDSASQSSRSGSESDSGSESGSDTERRGKTKYRPTPVFAREEPKVGEGRGKPKEKKKAPDAARGTAPGPRKQIKTVEMKEEEEESTTVVTVKGEAIEDTKSTAAQPVRKTELVQLKEEDELEQQESAPAPSFSVTAPQSHKEIKDEKREIAEIHDQYRLSSMRGPVVRTKDEEKKEEVKMEEVREEEEKKEEKVKRRGSASSQSSARSSSSSSSSSKDYSSDSDNDEDKRKVTRNLGLGVKENDQVKPEVKSEKMLSPPPALSPSPPPPSPSPPQPAVTETITEEVAEIESVEKSPVHESDTANAVEDVQKVEAVEAEQEEEEVAPAPAPVASEPVERRDSVISSSSAVSSSSSSSSGSAAISDRGPNLVNDPTAAAEDKQEQEQDRVEPEGRQLPVIIADDQVESKQTMEETVTETQTPMKERKNSESDKDSSSDTSSDSDNGSDSSDANNGKKSQSQAPNTEIQTTADVHQSEQGRRKSDSQHEPESDPEVTHGGNDPDNVANDLGGSMAKVVPAAAPPQPNEGSIIPLMEKNSATIELKNVALNKTQVYEAAQFLETKGGINHVNMVNCGMDDDDVQKIGEALKASPSEPVLLNLSLNPLSSGCVDHILDILENKPSIEAVLLQGTRLGDNGVERLVDGILRLHDEKKAEQSDEEPMKELRELDLSDCKFGDEGAESLARLISSDMDIDTLTLSSNHAVSSEGWWCIGKELGKNRSLETLTLDHNFIGDDGVEHIAAGLQNNKSVTALDLNDVGMTDKGGRCLVELLKRNIFILEITLMGNKLSEQMKEDINKYIQLNKTVTKV